MQTLEDKAAAIKSLLPLLVEHLDCMPMSMVIRRWDENGGGGGLDCDGRCESCDWKDSCRGAWWEVVREKLERRYRLKAIRISLRQLEHVNPTLHEAVYVCYIDPEDPIDDLDAVPRIRVNGKTYVSKTYAATLGPEWYAAADRGVYLMAEEIPGDVPAYGEKRKTKAEQIVEARETGCSIAFIAQQLRCSKSTVIQVLRAQKERSQSTLSAVG